MALPTLYTAATTFGHTCRMALPTLYTAATAFWSRMESALPTLYTAATTFGHTCRMALPTLYAAATTFGHTCSRHDQLSIQQRLLLVTHGVGVTNSTATEFGPTQDGVTNSRYYSD